MITAEARIWFSNASFGWGERHFVQAGTLASAYSAAFSLLSPRMACSRSDVVAYRLRVSDVDQKGDSRVGSLSGIVGTWPGPAGTYTCDSDVAVLLRLAGPAPLTPRSWHYLRGVPSDGLIGPAPLHVATGTPNYSVPVNAYLTKLQAVVVLRHQVGDQAPTWWPVTALNYDAAMTRVRRAGRPLGLRRGRRLPG